MRRPAALVVADTVTGRVTVVQLQVSQRHQQPDLKSESCSVSGSQDSRSGREEMTWTHTRTQTEIWGTYAAIVYIQCRFKFKPLHEFSSTCGMREIVKVKIKEEQGHVSASCFSQQDTIFPFFVNFFLEVKSI